MSKEYIKYNCIKVKPVYTEEGVFYRPYLCGEKTTIHTDIERGWFITNEINVVFSDEFEIPIMESTTSCHIFDKQFERSYLFSEKGSRHYAIVTKFKKLSEMKAAVKDAQKKLNIDVPYEEFEA